MQLDSEPTTTVADNPMQSVGLSNNPDKINTMLWACMIGNTLEWYDFVIYGYLATIFGQLFFPSADPLTQLLASWAVFWSGFVARPIGAIIFGHIGDKCSRKHAITWSIYVMAIPTALIGLLPTYENVGIVATVCLVLLRTLQGIALGGEFTGTLVFMVEHAAKNESGKLGSRIAFSAVLGIIFGSTLIACLNIVLPSDAMFSWGWRLPFMLSIIGSAVGAYMRTNLRDPSVYEELKTTNSTETLPLKKLLMQNRQEFVQILLLDFLTAIGFFMLAVFMVSYFKVYLHMPDDVTFTINTINMVVFAVAILIGGWLEDKYGFKKVLSYPCMGFMLFSYLLFMFFQADSYLLTMLAQTIFAIMFGVFFGAVPAILVRIMPTNVRYTGLSVAHNLSMAIFGGGTPFIATWLINSTGNIATPAFMLIIAAFMSYMVLDHIKE